MSTKLWVIAAAGVAIFGTPAYLKHRDAENRRQYQLEVLNAFRSLSTSEAQAVLRNIEQRRFGQVLTPDARLDIFRDFSSSLARNTTYSGGTAWRSDGTFSTRIGNTWWHSDGSFTNVMGNTAWHSNGEFTNRIGSSYFNSDGSSATQIGNTLWHDDGSTTTRIGNTYWHND